MRKSCFRFIYILPFYVILLFAGVFSGRALAVNATVNVDGDVACNFNGRGSVVRETFGLEPSGSWSKYQGQVWQSDSGCFGRIYLCVGDPSMTVLPGLQGRTEAEKRAIIFDPAYWGSIDMNQVTPFWPMWQRLAAMQPKNVFIMFYGVSWQFDAEPVFGVQPAALTPAQQQLVQGTSFAGDMQSIVDRAGYLDRSYVLNTDRAAYAQICVNLLAKIKALFPASTKFSVILDNEVNWFTMFCDKPIIDDVFTSLATYGDYQAGEVAAGEWLSQYNSLYSAIKTQLPDVKVGGPDVCDVDFSKLQAGRVRWNNFIKPIIDGASRLDFFDYHYGVEPDMARAISETISQYTQQTQGRSTPSVDSEAGSYVFSMSPDAYNQFTQGLVNEREWLGWLRNPDLTYGRAGLSLPKYFDGFGQATGAAMPFLMFRSLQGNYVHSTCDTDGIETVASINGNQIACVTLNSRDDTSQTSFKLHTPQGAVFVQLQAKLLWYDSETQKIRYANFQPITLNRTDGLVVNLSLPPNATCCLTAILDSQLSSSHLVQERRYGGDRVVFRVEPGIAQSVTIPIPGTILSDSTKTYRLRVGHECSVAGSGVISVNGQASYVLPAHTTSNNWDKVSVDEFVVNRAALQTSNVITFSVAPGGSSYLVEMASLLALDSIPAMSMTNSETVNLDIGSSLCAITEEEARHLPSWYLDKTNSMPTAMPPVRAYWNFDSATNGVVPDLGSNGNSGTLRNGAVLESGLKGNALACNGNGSYMRVEDSPSLHVGTQDSFSISLWVKLANGGSGGLIKKGSNKSITLTAQKGTRGNEFPVPMPEFTLSSPIPSTGTVAKGLSDLDDGKWHYIVAVRDVSEEVTIIYVDGKYAGSGSGVLHYAIDSAEPLCMGISTMPNPDGSAPATGSLNGLIDEATIYDGMLTPKQVEILYNDATLAVADASSNKVLTFSTTTGNGLGTISMGSDGPTYLTFGPGGDLFVACHNGNKVERFRAVTAEDIGAYVPSVQMPMGLAFGPSNKLYIGRDYSNASVFDGSTTTELATNLGKAIRGVTVGSDAVVYVASELNRQWSGNGFIHRYNTATGAWLSDWAVVGRAFNPEGIAFGPDASGDGLPDLYVCNWAGSIDILDGLTGADLGVFIPGVHQPADLVFSADGITLYYSTLSGTVYQYRDGQSTVFADAGDGLTSCGGLDLSNPYVPAAGASTGTLDVNVHLEDYVGDPWLCAVKLELLRNGTVTGTMIVNPQSTTFSYTYPNLQNGQYTVRATASHWLSRSASARIIGGIGRVIALSLPNGDVNGDGTLTNADTAIPLANLDQTGR